MCLQVLEGRDPGLSTADIFEHEYLAFPVVGSLHYSVVILRLTAGTQKVAFWHLDSLGQDGRGHHTDELCDALGSHLA